MTDVALYVLAKGFSMMSTKLLRRCVGHVGPATIGINGRFVGGKTLM